MSTVTRTSSSRTGVRIGEVAARTGTTTRTIRYYEELGLLPPTGERDARQHRLFTEGDIERLELILRLKQLLGLSLDELRDVVAAEDARGALREEWRRDDPPLARRRAIVTEALGHLDRQLALVARRREKLDELERELIDRQRLLHERLAEINQTPVTPA